MINSIIAAVSASLDKEFGDGYEIYMEEKKQDLQEPCFFIQCLEPSADLLRGAGSIARTNQFCIQYFPRSESDANRECNDTGERMLQCLGFIVVDGRMRRGTKRRYKVEDGMLYFFVNYDGIFCRSRKEEAMEDLQSRTEVKEDG